MPATLRRNSHVPTFPMKTGTCEGCTPGQVTAAFRLPYKGTASPRSRRIVPTNITTANTAAWGVATLSA